MFWIISFRNHDDLNYTRLDKATYDNYIDAMKALKEIAEKRDDLIHMLVENVYEL